MTADVQEDARPVDPAEPVLLREPADGVPEPVTEAADLASVARMLAAGTGPVAVDVERASGYRYSQRAYLVQLRRQGAGTHLIDPVPLPDLQVIGDALADTEWILHAASQDLPSLREVGLAPVRLFDTELAGRLLGDDRVALGTMVEQHLGVRLEKGFSAADWSTRPLPRDWLVYAALDVELLGELRVVLGRELAAAGKAEWARQEFEAVRTASAPAAREDPWRRTSGIHRLRGRRQLAEVKALWYARDQAAAARDVAPGRVLPDAALVAAVRADPKQPSDLTRVSGFRGPRTRRDLDRWWTALDEARRLPEDALPSYAGTSDGMPAANRWKDRDPAAAARLARARSALTTLAEHHRVLSQNLMASEVVRRLCWQPPEPPDEPDVRKRLIELGARPWQVDLCASALTAALTDSPTD